MQLAQKAASVRFLIFACMGATACHSSHLQRKKIPPSPASEYRQREDVRLQARLGVIESVNLPSGFVLIHIGTAPPPPTGTRLQVFSGSTSHAELVVSEHQKRPYLIADIVSGTPQPGESVAPILPGDSDTHEKDILPGTSRAESPAVAPLP
jgi:hypothetical protein